jgi:catechol 2,3-dioxygenase-like lactoylglutathione lyase family enzyme
MNTKENKSHTAYTGLIVKDPAQSREFYTTHLGFECQIDTGEYVHLQHPATRLELAILKAGELDHLKELENATTGMGLWIGLEVENADEESARLWDAGVTIVQPPTDQPWGERTIVIRDPDGVLIYLAHKIAVENKANLETQTATL